MRFALSAVAAALIFTTTVASEPVPPRPADGPQIAFEVRVLTVPDRFYERIGIDFESPARAPAPALQDGGILTDSQMCLLLEAVQGDRRASVLMAPKVTAESGQDASIQCLQQQVFVTGVDARRVNGQTVLIPRNTTVDAGLVETEFSIVRFKGDRDSAAAVYQGLDPLHPEDVADAVLFALTRPSHVNIGEIVLWPTAQASTSLVTRNKA